MIDAYYNSIKHTCECKISEEGFSTRYTMASKNGKCELLRCRLDEGFEVNQMTITRLWEMSFDNTEYYGEILEIGYCYEGEVVIEMLPSGEVVTIRAGDLFTYKINNNVDLFKFHYNGSKTISITMNRAFIQNSLSTSAKELLDENWRQYMECLFKKEFLMIEKASYAIEKIMEDLNELVVEDILAYVQLKARALEAIGRVIAEKKTQSSLCCSKCSDEDRIRKGISLIEDHFEMFDTVEALALKLNLSPYKLQKGFKKITGLTVNAYVVKRRMKLAEKLIRETDLSMLEISNEVGYANPSKFAKTFKSHEGISPLKYRKQKRA